ncbi:hypothetical protein WI664_00645 [Vibrio cholerae]
MINALLTNTKKTLPSPAFTPAGFRLHQSHAPAVSVDHKDLGDGFAFAHYEQPFASLARMLGISTRRQRPRERPARHAPRITSNSFVMPATAAPGKAVHFQLSTHKLHPQKSSGFAVDSYPPSASCSLPQNLLPSFLSTSSPSSGLHQFSADAHPRYYRVPYLTENHVGDIAAF